MKIARIETFLFDPGTAKNLLFCRVETESGIHGWGEAYVTPGKEQVIEHLLQGMAKYMLGRSAFDIRHTGQVLFDDFAMRRASLDLMSAWSAIEIALWDIVAKHANLPLYNLLGGVLWVGVCIGAGYLFGNIPAVKNNFSLVALGIVAVSLLPMLVEWLKHRKKGRRV